MANTYTVLAFLVLTMFWNYDTTVNENNGIDGACMHYIYQPMIQDKPREKSFPVISKLALKVIAILR